MSKRKSELTPIERERGKYLCHFREEVKRLVDEVDADTRHAVSDAFFLWFLGRETPQLDPLGNYIFNGLVQRQMLGAAQRAEKSDGGRKGGEAQGGAKADAARANGCIAKHSQGKPSIAKHSQGKPSETETETETETNMLLEGGGETRARNDTSSPPINRPPTREEVIEAAQVIGISENDTDEWIAYAESNGWRFSGGDPITAENFRTSLRSWVRRKATNSRFAPGGGNSSKQPAGVIYHEEGYVNPL